MFSSHLFKLDHDVLREIFAKLDLASIYILEDAYPELAQLLDSFWETKLDNLYHGNMKKKENISWRKFFINTCLGNPWFIPDLFYKTGFVDDKDHVKHYIFDALSPINFKNITNFQREKLLKVGFKLNLSHGRLKDMVKYQHKHDYLSFRHDFLPNSFAEYNSPKTADMLYELNLLTLDSDVSAVNTVVKNNHVEMLKWLITHGANLDWMDEVYETPIFFAIENNRLDMVEILCQGGADLDHFNVRHQTPLDIAIALRLPPIVKALLANGAGIIDYKKEEKDYVWRACMFQPSKEKTKIIKYLLEYDANPDLGKNCTPLQMVCATGDTTSIRLLLQHTANPLPTKNPDNLPAKLLINKCNRNWLCAVEDLAKESFASVATCAPELPFNLSIIFKNLRQCMTVSQAFKLILKEPNSDFGRCVILFALLSRNNHDDLEKKVVGALGHQCIETAAMELYKFIANFLGASDKLMDILQRNVIDKMKMNFADYSARFCLAYLESQINKSLENREDHHLAIVMKKLFDMLSRYPEKPVAIKLKNMITHLWKDKKNPACAGNILQTLVEFYYKMRMETSNANINIFAKCNFFADELEKFLIDSFQFPVPHVISKQTPIPVIGDSNKPRFKY